MVGWRAVQSALGAEVGDDQLGELGKGFLEELTLGQVLKMSRRVCQMGEEVGEGHPRFWLGLGGPSVKPWVCDL